MSSKPQRASALDLVNRAAEERTPEKRDVVRSVVGSQLSQKKKRAPEKSKEGCNYYKIRNLPNSSKPRYDAIVDAGLFRESFNQYMLDAIEEKLKRDERAIARLAAKGE